jgi:hypothetical protein
MDVNKEELESIHKTILETCPPTDQMAAIQPPAETKRKRNPRKKKEEQAQVADDPPPKVELPPIMKDPPPVKMTLPPIILDKKEKPSEDKEVKEVKKLPPVAGRQPTLLDVPITISKVEKSETQTFDDAVVAPREKEEKEEKVKLGSGRVELMKEVRDLADRAGRPITKASLLKMTNDQLLTVKEEILGKKREEDETKRKAIVSIKKFRDKGIKTLDDETLEGMEIEELNKYMAELTTEALPKLATNNFMNALPLLALGLEVGVEVGGKFIDRASRGKTCLAGTGFVLHSAEEELKAAIAELYMENKEVIDKYLSPAYRMVMLVLLAAGISHSNGVKATLKDADIPILKALTKRESPPS